MYKVEEKKACGGCNRKMSLRALELHEQECDDRVFLQRQKQEHEKRVRNEKRLAGAPSVTKHITEKERARMARTRVVGRY